MSFPNITLLECNRMQSDQKGSEGDDNAIFTNKMGKVVELDVGDTIEVKSAFINKRGCANPNSIEFKGKTLGVNVKFTETQTNTTQIPSDAFYDVNNRYPEIYYYSDITSNLQVGSNLNTDAHPVPQENNVRQGGLAFRQIFNEEVEKDLVDNEAYFETNFYKNANGENTCMLPRNFFRERIESYDATTNSPYSVHEESYFNRCNFDVDVVPSTVSGSLFSNKGSYSGISEYLPENSYYDGRGFYGMTDGQAYFNAFCPTDYRFFKQATTYSVASDTTNVEPFEKELKPVYSNTDNVAGFLRNSVNEFSEFRPKNDNSRFYLFEREYDWLVWPNTPQANAGSGYTPEKEPNYTFITETGANVVLNAETWFTPSSIDAVSGFPKRFRRAQLRSPALFPYLKRTKLNKIKVDKGYSTPQSLAEQITIELQKEDEDSPFISNKKLLDYSTGIRTKFYQPSICADNNFNKVNYSTYFSSDGSDSSEAGFKWWRNYHNILIKRPGLYEEGIKINTRYGYVGTPTQQLANEDPRDDDSGIGNYIQNSISVDSSLGNNTTDSIETGWLYTESNLKMLSKLFDEQGKYPELFYDETKGLDHNAPFMNQFTNTNGGEHIEWGTPATIDNSRFLHINRFDIDITQLSSGYDGGNVFNILGDDGFVRITTSKTIDGELRGFDTDHRSTAFFFKYDPQYRNIDTGGDDSSRLSYGFATKVLKADGYEYIVLHPELVNGLRPDVFALRGGSSPYDNAGNSPTYEQPWVPASIKGRDGGNDDYTIIGWDYHYTSWGNVVMFTTNGLKPSGYNYDETTRAATFGDKFFYNQGGDLGIEEDMTESLTLSTIFISENYLGSNNIACKFDAVSNRFGFEFLHRPENQGNSVNAGSTDFINAKKDTDPAVPVRTFPINDNATDEVLKINKRLFKSNWCADMVPYIEQDGEVDIAVNGTTRGRIDIKPMNINLEPWVVYDSRTGVSINFGKTALIESNKYLASQVASWDNSLLGILGFSFDQFNPTTITSKNNSLARITNRNIRSVYNPSTNAQFLPTNTNLFRMNEYGANFMDTNLPTALSVELLDAKSYNAAGGSGSVPVNWLYLPPIVIGASSVVIEAVNLPRVALFPYMTIRSDVMRPQKYIGGLNSGLSLPVCAVVNRINAEKDFIQYS
jgi:hypothetical protein